MKKTIFLDIDGTILEHKGDLQAQITSWPKLLPGVKAQFDKWILEEATIILTTGRKESSRGITEEQLASVGIVYDQLIMGLGRGPRIVYNDKKPDSDIDTAIAINVIRNAGL